VFYARYVVDINIDIPGCWLDQQYGYRPHVMTITTFVRGLLPQ
jgi:hypothetical protein